MKYTQVCIVITGIMALASCAASPERQAMLDEFERTIPTCTTESDCSQKWAAARIWVLENSNFAIRSESNERIMATSNITTSSGQGVTVNRMSTGTGYQILVSVECFNSFGCPGMLDAQIDFNRTLNAVGN
ncbi:MAG: hypothetical protein VX605_01285, partial [Pseudomonadota bacterium]|nr:hypothetical protein [Pseudomonadota bacterium]